MARNNIPIHTFNRGRISVLGLGRTDLGRTKLSAEKQTNWIPRVLGSMMLRPGLEYIGQTKSDAACRLIPFVFATNDTALVEITDLIMRVWVSDALITRTGVSATVTNGTFASNLTGWTDVDQSGAVSSWATGGYMSLVGTNDSHARRYQLITVTETGTEHALRVTIERGDVAFKVGSTLDGDEYISETVLKPGVHSLAFTPTGNFYIDFRANSKAAVLVDSVTVETSGTMELPTLFTESDLANLRWDDSADVIFVAAKSLEQRRIERRATRSWSIVKYQPPDGPFRNPNTGQTKLTPSALNGDITLDADNPLFSTNHIGALFQITSIGQKVEGTHTGDDQWTDPIRVSGVDNTRIFDILVSQSSTGDTIRVQRSVGEIGSWADVSGLVWTTTVDTTHDDGLDNQIIFYRIGTKSGDFTASASATMLTELDYPFGGITGTARITAVPASTQSSASVLTDFGSTASSETWQEGDWSAFRGFPTATAFHEGRLWWGGKSKIWGSVSDAYESFDADVEGDSGPINRSVGSGPVDNMSWLVSLTRLVLGTDGQEIQAKTSSLEEALTPSNFTLRPVSGQGSANVQAVTIDQRALFVQQGGARVFETGISGTAGSVFDLVSADRTILVPEIGEPSIVRMAVQRQPDTRVHCVRSDGTVGMLISDPAEDVVAWIDVETGDADGTNGVVEEVAVLPGTIEEDVYYVVKRVINGSTVRFIEKWAKESEAVGGANNRIADSFIVSESTLSTIASTHLVAQTVTIWGAGIDQGTAVVDSTGGVSIPTPSTTTIIGLGYGSLYVSAKLAYSADAGTALTQRKRINHLGLILANVHALGLEFGPSTSRLDPLPKIEGGALVSTDTVHTAYDQPSIPFPGNWDTDSRLCLVGTAPRPVTVLAAVIGLETKDKI